jgi:hypothetical protein
MFSPIFLETTINVAMNYHLSAFVSDYPLPMDKLVLVLTNSFFPAQPMLTQKSIS